MHRGGDRRIARDGVVVAEQPLAKIRPGFVDCSLSNADRYRWHGQWGQRLDVARALEPPHVSRRVEGDDMQPFMQKRQARRVAAVAIRPVEHYNAGLRRITEQQKLRPVDRAQSRVEIARLVAELQTADETQVGKLAQQRQRFSGVHAVVVWRLGWNLDLGHTAGDAVDPH